MRQIVTWLLTLAGLAGMHLRAGSKWRPRMLAVAAIFWADSDHATLANWLNHACKIIQKIFHRQPAPSGETLWSKLAVAAAITAQIDELISTHSELRSAA